MSKFRKRFLGWLFVLSALVVGAGGYWLVSRYMNFADTPLVGIEAGDSIVVERGDSFVAVLGKLYEAGVPSGQEIEWQVLSRQMGVAGRLQVGEYALEPGTTPRALLQRMRDGKVVSHRFTIIEGWNIRELRAALARATPLQQEGAKLDDAALMEALGATGQHPEGRFLPETYHYTRGDSDIDLLKRAHAAMAKALDAAWDARVSGLPLENKEQALVLASIVEKETGLASERPAIAGVFVRRLQTGMLLQTDPTVIYGMGERYNGNIRRSDLTTDTPYNTYTRAGLPPTPIAMPGVDALNAATQPKQGDSLYFVAVGDGSGRHVFSRTLAEHNVAVREYVRRYRLQHGGGAKPADAPVPNPPTPDPASVAPPKPESLPQR